MSKAVFQSDLLTAAEARMPADGLRALRQSHLADAQKHGFPTSKDEDWRYTNLSSAVELSNNWLRAVVDSVAPTPEPAPPAMPEIDAHCLVLADGLVDEVSLHKVQQQLGNSARITRLRDEASEVVVDGPLDTLNAALIRDGLHIRIPANIKAAKPLAIFMHDGASAASQSRVVIDVAENASVEIIEYHVAGGDTEHFANTVVQLNLAQGARASMVRLQQRNRKHVQTGKLAATLQRDSFLAHAAFDLGGGLIRNDIVADIRGAGAEVHMNGLYLADGEQYIDNHTRVDHRVGPAASREEYRGILNDRARCVFNGKAIVHKGADGTDAEQANHNLLLSARAEVDTKPELEIYADDVKCAHGATVGELDEAAIFYMQSRGLDREQAAHMLTRAFAAQVLSKLPIVALHEHIEALIDARLDQLLRVPTA
ncbi:MAG: Fe-S cluster assembly protein SufD [Woeseia sp.]